MWTPYACDVLFLCLVLIRRELDQRGFVLDQFWCSSSCGLAVGVQQAPCEENTARCPILLRPLFNCISSSSSITYDIRYPFIRLSFFSLPPPSRSAKQDMCRWTSTNRMVYSTISMYSVIRLYGQCYYELDVNISYVIWHRHMSYGFTWCNDFHQSHQSLQNQCEVG